MCEFCHSYICPPACPSYCGVSAEFGRPIATCSECGDYIYESDLYYVEKRKFFCADCAMDI